MRSKLSDLFLSLAIAGVLCLSPCHRMESKIAACEAHLKDCQDVCLSIPLCRVICTSRCGVSCVESSKIGQCNCEERQYCKGLRGEGRNGKHQNKYLQGIFLAFQNLLIKE